MFKYIESNASIITINRGDSFQKPLFINCGTLLNPQRYIIQEHDKVYLGVMEPNKFWEQSIIMQTYTTEDEMTEEGDLIIKINPEDTEYLIPGLYYYMIKLVTYDINDKNIEQVKTVVPKTIFNIL